MDIKKKIRKAPDRPGVYLMKDRSGRIIYIGKAASLRKRLSSYSRSNFSQPSKQKLLVSQIHYLDYILTDTETQALLLEAELIKKYEPKYNVERRDDKSFPLLKITAEEFPSVFICRPKKKDKARYFGPYTNAKAIRGILKNIRNIFPFRTCRRLPKKECLDYHINLCPAPCIHKISKKGYAKSIRNIILILEGRYEKLLEKLTSKMRRFSKARKFEEAAEFRDQIMALGSIYTVSGINSNMGETQQLKNILRLSTLPLRIEAFDVSNIYGRQAVGSMVSFYQGKPDKNNYRRFRIKESQGIDDYKMLAEITRRRYGRLKQEQLSFPDLIVIDGGKGQLGVVKDTLNELELAIPVISIAKQHEEIFIPDKKKSIILPKTSPALKLIRRIRDEAHRFALAYHHILRRKKTFEEK